MRDWINNPIDTHCYWFSSRSILIPDMVTRLQSVIGKEVKTQLLEKEGRDYPDYLMHVLVVEVMRQVYIIII